jgi:hemerythrin
MQFLEWKDSYNIGVKEIDNQHRGLFDIISKLFTSQLYEPDGKYFFLMMNMQEAEYPKFAEHRHEHELFIAQLVKILKDIEKKEPDIESKTLSFLKDWYLDHILGTDRDLEKPFHAKGFQ